MNKRIIKRTKYLESFIHLKDTTLIKIVTGIRRCGTFTLRELFQYYLQKSGVAGKLIIAITLEAGEFRGIQIAEALYDHGESSIKYCYNQHSPRSLRKVSERLKHGNL